MGVRFHRKIKSNSNSKKYGTMVGFFVETAGLKNFLYFSVFKKVR